MNALSVQDQHFINPDPLRKSFSGFRDTFAKSDCLILIEITGQERHESITQE